MASESIFEQLRKGFADAVTDIREKVVEEPMYGRTVTDREPSAPQWPEAKQEQSFGSLTQSREVGHEPAQDNEIDR